MPRLRTQSAKDRLLRRMRKQRLKSITVLPSLVTILNGVCGFAGIIFAGKGQFTEAGYMILLAMVADVLDGRLARMSKTTSSFGGQLDSLCDVMSFGVAPAFLMLKVLEHEWGFGRPDTAVENFWEHFIWLVAAVYVSCAAIRLARFNVENEEDESAHMSFIGLPTPAAGGVIVSLVIFHQETAPILSETNSSVRPVLENVVFYSLPVVTISLAVLMVSRIRYPHVLNQYIRGKKPFAQFIRVLLGLGLIVWGRQAALVLIFCGFASSGFLKWFYYKVVKKSPLLVTEQQGSLSTAEGPIIEENGHSPGGAG